MATVLTWIPKAETPESTGGSASTTSDRAPATGDIRLTWDNAQGAADVSIINNDLARDDGLETAVLLSLFTDRQAEASDVLPDGGTDRRGWWADAVADVDGDKFGSRLWLLARAKPAEFVARAPEYAKEALAWFVDDQVAERVEARASIPRADWALLEVDIYRPQQKEPTRFRFAGVWRAEEGI